MYSIFEGSPYKSKRGFHGTHGTPSRFASHELKQNLIKKFWLKFSMIALSRGKIQTKESIHSLKKTSREWNLVH